MNYSSIAYAQSKINAQAEKHGRIRYSSIIIAILGLLVLFETFSGALRFYFDQVDLVALIYIPKFLCLIAVLIKLVNIKNFRTTGWAISLLLLSSFIAFYHGATIFNSLFSLYNFSPLLFGVFYGRYIEVRSKEFRGILLFSLIVSISGVFLDKFLVLPWEGYNYSIGDLAIEGNRQWTTIGIQRIAGFSRVSSSLAITLAVCSIFLNSTSKSLLLRVILTLLTIYCIFLTTSKSVLVAYIISLVATLIIKWRITKVLFLFVTAIGIILPFGIIMLKYQGVSQLITDDLGVFLLASFDARLTYTWPSFYDLVEKNSGIFFGTGFGTVGSSVSTFPIKGLSGSIRQSLSVADNTALYLWGMLGVGGIVAYLYSYFMMVKLRAINSKTSFVLAEILVCLGISAWAVDVLETVFGCLFVGFSVFFATNINKDTKRFKKLI